MYLDSNCTLRRNSGDSAQMIIPKSVKFGSDILSLKTLALLLISYDLTTDLASTLFYFTPCGCALL